MRRPFGADEPAWDSGALIDGGHLYAYSCGRASPCLLARVETSRALDRAAWRFYAGPRGWSADWREGLRVLDASGSMSVHWNAYLGKFLAVHDTPLGNDVAMRLADRPEGPWSEPVVIIEGASPDRPDPVWRRNSFAVGHAHLAREGGRIETVGYFHPRGPFGGEVRFVEVAFR